MKEIESFQVLQETLLTGGIIRRVFSTKLLLAQVQYKLGDKELALATIDGFREQQAKVLPPGDSQITGTEIQRKFIVDDINGVNLSLEDSIAILHGQFIPEGSNKPLVPSSEMRISPTVEAWRRLHNKSD